MTSRERWEKALRFEEPDRPPHFEQMFELVEEAFGLSFPSEDELGAATGKEREKLYARTAEVYARTIEEFKWDAVTVWRPAARSRVQYDFIPFLKKYLGPDILVGAFIWDSAVSIDAVDSYGYMQFSIDLFENPGKLHAWARGMLDVGLDHAARLIDAGCDILDIASDYAFNSGTFISPAQFREFTTPYMSELVSFIKDNGVTVIFHSDGNLMGVLDQILEIGPDVLQSIDPMAGMDIAEVKRLTYGRMALMGNVQCSLLQDGPAEKIRESADYCLDHGAPGGGFIYSTSNTIFKGIPLENYRHMVEHMWQRYGGAI